MRAAFFLFSCSLLFLSGCVRTIAISTMGGMIDDGFSALTEEQDLEFAEAALPANLKLLEVMLKNEPEDERLLLLLSEGYNSYALGFVEDRDPGRARDLYLRGRDFALRVLRKNARMAEALTGPVDRLQTELAALRRDQVPAVFWAAFGWGSSITLSLSDPDALADLPRAEAMMRFVAEKDSSFYYGGAHLFLGTLYGSRPRIFGGDPEVSRRHFETALRINGGTFLMSYVYFARSYAVQTLDEGLFEDLLGRVESTPLDVLPEFRLANAIAKKKARLLLDRKADLF